MRGPIMRFFLNEDINFLVTNRLPRRFATQLIGRIARIEHPLVARPSIGLWKFFAGVDLSDARTTRFKSLRDGFVRPLREGARAFDSDPDTLASPCDALVGAHGLIEDDRLYQIKGFPYRLHDLIPDPALVERFRDGSFVTLRLTAGMYHRFHAPADIAIEGVTYISGDCWNVNPIALKRVERLFCRNERAVIEARTLIAGQPLLIVPVAAILVASIRLHCLDTERTLRERGPGRTPCTARVAKGEEMGWFEHGSTIILFLPKGMRLADHLTEGQAIRAGDVIGRPQ
ncbi:phosphatidylserine decarboxylase [Sphingomonas paucimobilis]|nr:MULTISPECIES: archaetidylserine decarboxylase [Sphingomonas]MBQ1478412.1 phosphatidylserine decarboxylase [Sphingomonas sp.]MCM3679742.1 archaetidylserine decarboxylase [Sphingomonas paucimobilis]MDG5970865.1 archaetidylserine decarboxylase [Sphingomonas paucimobilis]QPS15521.1 phosphatidylserine decarboxylase [Sphingomonas paucimobilis]QPT10275.1 phosphatidylserine decarboxylase [Sphingomonas paucimobilis]